MQKPNKEHGERAASAAVAMVRGERDFSNLPPRPSMPNPAKLLGMQPPPLPPPRQAPAPQWPVMNNNGCNPVPYPPFIVVLFTEDINVDIPYPPYISRMHPP